MPGIYAPSTRQRWLSAIAAGAIVAGGVAVLVFGLSMRLPGAPQPTPLAAVVSLPDTPRPPPPPEQPAKARSSPAKGQPSPRNLKNKAAQVFAAPQPVPAPSPPPIVAVDRPGLGSAAQNGASDRLGPGQGAGGIGDGLGGGGNGDGDGYGDAVTRPRQIKGKLHYSDLPEDLREAHEGGELELSYRVGVDGRVSQCRIRQSSGRPELDRRTCALITERFRFKPSKDSEGNPVPSYIVERHGWFSQPEDGE